VERLHALSPDPPGAEEAEAWKAVIHGARSL
jgi:hypothetical protein